MGLLKRWRAVAGLFAVATVIHAVRSSKSHGTFMGVPFEFRPPTPRRVKERWWNREDGRVFTPHVFGVGWSVNLPALSTRLKAIRSRGDEDQGGSVAPSESRDDLKG